MKKRILVVVAAALALSATAAFAQAVYPLKGSPSVKYWMVTKQWVNKVANFGETPFAKELQARTGMGVTFLHPPAGREAETFNLLLASGDLPDLIEYRWFDRPGGPEKYLKDGYIIKLNDALKKWAPNLLAYLKAHPEVDRMVKTDDGDYYAFPFIRGDEKLMVFQGPMLRQDWLDELKLPVPTTIDEWTAVLKAFKEKKGAEAPLSMRGQGLWSPADFGNFRIPAFVGAFGIQKDYFVKDGAVKYGPAEPQYRDFVALMRKWYVEGLLDKNIAMVDQKLLDANMIAGKTGAIVGNAGSGMGYYINLMKDKDPNFKLVAAPYPTLKKGERPMFGQRSPEYTIENSVAITTACKNVEAAVRFLDYGYSPEGSMLYNFGIEGVSYRMTDGFPAYTDAVKNKGAYDTSQMAMYIRGNLFGPFVQDVRYNDQYLELPAQQKALVTWAATDMAKYQMPLILPKESEASEIARIMNEVNTFVAESFMRMVLGVTPLEDFPKFQEQLKQLKIGRALEIYQAAYDRYLKR